MDSGQPLDHTNCRPTYLQSKTGSKNGEWKPMIPRRYIIFTTQRETCPSVNINLYNSPSRRCNVSWATSTWHKHIFAKRKQLGITLAKIYWLFGSKFTGCSDVSHTSLEATNFSSIKPYSNQFGLTECNSGVQLPLPT
jgi:hypothetical protein